MKPIVMHFVSKQQPRKEKRCYITLNNEHWTKRYYLSLSDTISYGSKLQRTLYCGKKCEKFLYKQGNGKYKIQTFPPPATASQSKAEKWELEVFEEMLLTSRAVGRGYNDGGVSYYLETSSIFTRNFLTSFFLSSQLKLLYSNHFRSVPFHYL